MSYNQQKVVLEKSKTKGPQRLLLMVLAFHANKDTGLCCPSHETLVDETGMSLPTVKRVVGQLKDSGEVLVSDGRGRGNSNHYIITLGRSAEEIKKEIDDYEKNGIRIDTIYWEQKVSGMTPYNEEKGINSEEKGINIDTSKPTKGINFERKGINSDTSMLTKRTKSKRELKGESEQPPPVSAKPNGKANGHIGELLKPERVKIDELRAALCDLCKIHTDPNLATPKQVADIKAAMERLCPQDATAEGISKDFRNYWYSQDWRGQKGEPPTPMQVCELWPRVQGKKKNGSRLGQLNDDQLAAYKAMAEAEGR